jgi:Protein of unknown function (DUF2490)
VRLFLLIFLFCFASWNVLAQESETKQELWPEIDVYVPLNKKFRLFFLATVTKARETRDSFEGQLGAHVDYFWRDHLSFRVGYRYGTSLGDSDNPFREHRIITEQSFRKKTKWSIQLTDRNRQDWRWVNGDFSFRYRNRITAEKEFRVWGRPVAPYGSAEVFYDSRFSTFNRYRFSTGLQYTFRKYGSNERLLLLMRKQRVLDIYYFAAVRHPVSTQACERDRHIFRHLFLNGERKAANSSIY